MFPLPSISLLVLWTLDWFSLQWCLHWLIKEIYMDAGKLFCIFPLYLLIYTEAIIRFIHLQLAFIGVQPCTYVPIQAFLKNFWKFWYLILFPSIVQFKCFWSFCQLNALFPWPKRKQCANDSSYDAKAFVLRGRPWSMCFLVPNGYWVVTFKLVQTLRNLSYVAWRQKEYFE